MGAAAITLGMGRVTDLYGPRAGIRGILAFALLGSVLLVAGWSPVFKGAAMVICGSFHALRFIATGVVGGSFTETPLAWDSGVFDTAMGIPTVCGAILAGLPSRAAHSLPFVLVIAVSAAPLVGLLFTGRIRSVCAGTRSGRELAETTD